MPAVFQDATLHPMIEAALKAAHIALLRRKENLNVKTKDDGSKVTAGDYQSQQIIKAELEKISPAIAAELGVDNIGFLMEESIDGNHPNFAARMQGAHWVVDPIDGTFGYSRKHGDKAEPWAISISLEKNGETIAAVVYEASTNEYGTSLADFSSIDPSHPKGNIFIAHKDAEYAYKASGNDNAFIVTASPGETYPQETRKLANGNELPVLKKIPDLTTDFEQTKFNPVTPSLKSGAKPYIDGFFQDGQTRNTASQTTYKSAFLKQLGLKQGDYDDCYSAVAGAMRAADGRASAYLAGRCYPWDASAARLIIEKSGASFAELRVGDGSEQRTMLIGGHDHDRIKEIKKAVSEMSDEKGEPVAGETVSSSDRLGFLGRVARTALGAVGLTQVSKYLGLEEDGAVQTPVSSSNNSAVQVIERLPGSVEELEKLSDEQKILLAACTASGCDAVAYYTPNEQGGFSQAQRITMYPAEYFKDNPPQFEETIANYRPDTYSKEKIRSSTQYHIPVYAVDAEGKATDQIKGIIVLHAPTAEYGKLQATDTDNKNDLHEPVAARIAKLVMAKDIVAEHQDLFGASGKLLKDREAHHKTIGQKLSYFKKIIEDSYATLGEGNDEQSHTQSVAKLMDLAVSKILRKKEDPLVSNDQAELIHDLAELHDIGKSQISSGFMRPWKHLVEQSPGADKYFAEQNHNHPLFTLLELLLYPAEAKMAAAHHHGVFRYSNEELEHALGKDFASHSILKDNLKPEEISPLSYLMRICDVTESMTGRGDKGLEQAVQELAGKVQMKDGKPVIAPGTIHPDYLCLAIEQGVFDHYERNKNPEKLKAVEQQILEKFGWVGEAAKQKSQALLDTLSNDPLLVENQQVSVASRIAPIKRSSQQSFSLSA